MKGITTRELHDLLESPEKDKVLLIDVRTPGEQEVSKLPGRVLTKEEFEPKKDSLKADQLVVYWYAPCYITCMPRYCKPAPF